MSSLAHRIVSGVPLAVATIALAACGGISRSGPVADQTLPNAPALDQARVVAPLLVPAPPNIVGTYAGTLTIIADGQHLNGTLTIGVKQQGKKINGTWDAVVNSQTEDLSFTGMVKAGKGGVAHVKLKITDPQGSCTGNATGGVTAAGAFTGKGSGQQCGNVPKFTFTFKTQKQ
jgi:hypothetical protein